MAPHRDHPVRIMFDLAEKFRNHATFLRRKADETASVDRKIRLEMKAVAYDEAAEKIIDRAMEVIGRNTKGMQIALGSLPPKRPPIDRTYWERDAW